jgi:hypothetical protein
MSQTHRVLVALLAAVLLAGSAEAAGGEWTRSFGAPAAGTYLSGDHPAVLVAAAGVGPEARAAAAALIAALRASGRARVVMDSTPLGPVEALSDRAVVKQAAALPVQVVAVLRVFPGADGPMAVATFYDLRGQTLAALSVAKGAALTPRAGGAGSGVSQEAAAAVDRVLAAKAPETPKVDAREQPPLDPKEQQYRLRRVGFRRLVVLHAYTGLISGHWGSPFRGIDSTPLGPAEFYEAVGRPDHAAFYRTRSRIRAGLIVPGIILLISAPVIAVVGGLGYPRGPCREQDSFGGCLTRADGGARPLMWSGIVGTGVGIGALIAGLAIKSVPTAPDENYRLAAEHNRKLRRELGLPEKKDEDLPEVALAPRAPPTHLVVTPVLAAGGGGLAVHGSFR